MSKSSLTEKLIQAITDTKDAILQKTTADLQAKQMEVQANIYHSQLVQQQANAVTNLQGLQGIAGQALYSGTYYPSTAITAGGAPTNTLTWTGVGVSSGGCTTLPNSGYTLGTFAPPVYTTTPPVMLEFIVDMIFAAVQKALEEDMRRIIREELASKDVNEAS